MNNMMRYEPISLLKEINRLFDQNYRSWPGSDISNVDTSQWVPAVDIQESSDQFKIFVDLPGLDKKDIQLAMENNVLTIQGKREEEHKEEEAGYSRVERVHGSFYRRFNLPNTADGTKINARMQKGVLEIIVPKQMQAQPRAIDIKD